MREVGALETSSTAHEVTEEEELSAYRAKAVRQQGVPSSGSRDEERRQER